MLFDYPKYDNNSKCVKCAGVSIKSEYRETDYMMNDNMTAYTEMVTQAERIKRTCETCGYKWNEAPLDQNKQKKINKKESEL